MDKLITADAVKTRIGQDTNIDNDDFIESAILAAQQQMQTLLGTPLGKVTDTVEQFFLDENANFSMRRGGFVRCKLSRGFATLTSVTAAIEWNSATPTALTLGTDFRFDSEKGYVSVFVGNDAELTQSDRLLDRLSGSSSLLGQYLNVTYSAGFAVGDTLPDWLSEALILYTPSMFTTINPTNRNAEADAGYRNLQRMALDLIEGHRRDNVNVLRPL